MCINNKLNILYIAIDDIKNLVQGNNFSNDKIFERRNKIYTFIHCIKSSGNLSYNKVKKKKKSMKIKDLNNECNIT